MVKLGLDKMGPYKTCTPTLNILFNEGATKVVTIIALIIYKEKRCNKIATKIFVATKNNTDSGKGHTVKFVV